MEKKKRSKKLVPYAAVSSLAVILVAGGIFAYTGMNDEEVTKKESTPKTSMNKEKEDGKEKDSVQAKAKEQRIPTLGTVIAKVEEKTSTESLVRSSVVENSPVEQILQTLAKVPEKIAITTNEVPVNEMKVEVPEDEILPEIIVPEVPETPVIPEPTPNPIPNPEEPVVPEEPETPDIPEIINDAPSIDAESQELAIGSSFHAAEYATASDKEDGDITSSIQIVANNVNSNEEGSYQVTYGVSDSNGAYVEKTIIITIVNDRPEIMASDQQISIGGDFNPLVGVKATDKEDGDITSSVQVVSNDVDTTLEGTYHVTYSVLDNYGKAASQVTIQVIVKNDLPTIEAINKTMAVGDNFVPLDGVTANDKQDGDLTNQILVTSNDVDTATPGEYSVSYEVTDQNGGSVTKTITVTVEELPQN
ncbi:immunoglobulin-like domain-containing protein [Listeria seeligeri]|uniref:immunoglobulin-like domain-containing protein n=1 Tax=Listeria seeligeri TaxID=1640 RepID=UPI0010EC3FAE|nr:immunoglobulin-like domain-containing protein [Listeria seeligeri]